MRGRIMQGEVLKRVSGEMVLLEGSELIVIEGETVMGESGREGEGAEVLLEFGGGVGWAEVGFARYAGVRFEIGFLAVVGDLLTRMMAS